MVPMTGSAGGRGEIAALGNGLPVNAGPVVGELVGFDLVLGHVLRIGVAPGAGLGQPQRMNGRQRIPNEADIVHAVAVDAGSHSIVPTSQTLAVNAGLVLGELI